MGLLNRIKGVVKLSATTGARDDSGSIPIQQHSQMGKGANAAVWRQYGFDANVPPGELSLLLAVLANPDARVALQGFTGKGPELASGEVTVFHPSTGSKLHFRSDGSVEVETGESKIVVTPAAGIDITPTPGMPVTVNGDLVVTGTATIAGLLAATTSATVGTTLVVTGASTMAAITSNGTSVDDTHTHPVTTAPGTTGVPN